MDNGFEVAESTYIANIIENQCYFCTNEIVAGEEICKECKDGILADLEHTNRMEEM